MSITINELFVNHSVKNIENHYGYVTEPFTRNCPVVIKITCFEVFISRDWRLSL